MQKHSCRVQTLISQLLEAGTLRALQVAAVHSSLCIDYQPLGHLRPAAPGAGMRAPQAGGPAWQMQGPACTLHPPLHLGALL